METLPPELTEKFSTFRTAYDEARVWLVGAGGPADDIARNTLNAALSEVPLSKEELELYKAWVKDN